MAADAQIDIADDAGDTPRLAVFAGRTHRRDAVDELGLAERFPLLRAVGAVHLAAFLETGRGDVVAAADIGEQVLEQIAVARPVPHVMVRVDDRQIGLDDRLAPAVEPVLPDRRMAAGRDRGLGHWQNPPEVAVGCANCAPARPALPWFSIKGSCWTSFARPRAAAAALAALTKYSVMRNSGSSPRHERSSPARDYVPGRATQTSPRQALTPS